MFRHLLLTPLVEVLDLLREAFSAQGHPAEDSIFGRLSCTSIPTLQLVMAHGGHGKAQFAVHTQHLIDHCPTAELIICAGAAGGISDSLVVGDVVVGTASVEHDYRIRFIVQPLPRFPADAATLAAWRKIPSTFPFQVHFGPIASGDEDVVSAERAQEIACQTEALCVAWEGAGAACAAAFNCLPCLEVRAITDTANHLAPEHFDQNLPLAMQNIAKYLEQNLTTRSSELPSAGVAGSRSPISGR
jgi:adenosylhomocysteine nucleosidase